MSEEWVCPYCGQGAEKCPSCGAPMEAIKVKPSIAERTKSVLRNDTVGALLSGVGGSILLILLVGFGMVFLGGISLIGTWIAQVLFGPTMLY
jgi:hypothetical protein